MRSMALAVPCLLVVGTGNVSAEAPSIEHAPVKCIVAGRYPRLLATVTPAPVARARAYFRAEGVPSWYYVEMAPDASADTSFAGVLPKPTRKLVGRRIEYYVEAASRSFESARTNDFDPLVVTRAEECHEQLVAAFAPGPPLAVFPSLPGGFAVAGGVPTAAIAAVGGGAAAAGTAVVAKKDDKPTTTAPPPTAPTPATAPVAPAGPVPTPQPPPRGLEASCNAQPRQGMAPLRVTFAASASGGTGAYNFAWVFGDGETSSQVTPGHTYARPGTYEAAVHVTSGDRAARCARTIVVTAVADELELTVRREGSGLGTVTGPNIACGTDCSEVLARGTVATLSAAAATGSAFTGWSGDCASDPCSVRMDQPRTVVATFQAQSTLTVALAGNGAGSVTGPGIACGADCGETYLQGANVTLTATPAPGSQFAGWSGACANATGTCSPQMTGAVSVTATFQPILFPLTVSRTGSGAPFVRLAAPGIDCGTDCSESYPSGTDVGIAHEPLPGAPATRFDGWTGCSGGTGDPCTVSMTAARTVTAAFTRLFLLEVTVAGPAGTRVASAPAGIDCRPTGPSDCAESYDGGQVTLFATPTDIFDSWTGDCAASTGPTCTLTMNADRTVGAVFEFGPNLAGRAAGRVAPASLNWSSQLQVPDASGRVLGNGTDAGVTPAGVTQLSLVRRAGVNRVEAQLQSGSGQGGTWRFELLDRGAIEPGSLTAQDGEPLQVTGEAIVFRVSGRAGERVAFTFRTKD
jgi:hypothetical protein